MPVTQGHGNPDWSREETMLALELLYRHGKPVDRHHADVLELSLLLRSANIHRVEKRNERFRNPDGVALKLQNLLSAVEPGRGLSYSKTDLAVVQDFPKERTSELSRICIALRSAIIGDPVPVREDDEEFLEGRWLSARHRQRDARLRKRLLKKYVDQPLQCEICDFFPPDMERTWQESFFEAHHKIPLAAAEGLRVTKLADVALLCACCHRFLHTLISQNRRWMGIEEARSVLPFKKLHCTTDR